MNRTVLHPGLPFAPWADPAAWRLPGMQPAERDGWIEADAAFAGQMALRDHLIATREAEVHALRAPARDAANEALEAALAILSGRAGYSVGGASVTRPDGVTVPIREEAPLLTLGRLVQEDICLMLPSDEGHRLEGAILCFPASWTLAEKIGRPLIGIHGPVREYDPDLARRVQRLFDALRPERPLWRANALFYEDPALFQPRREDDPRPLSADPAYLRTERQTLVRLQRTQAVLFSIHTVVVERSRLSPDQAEGIGALTR